MAKEPTYEELKKRVKALEKEAAECKETEHALRKEKEKFQILVDESPLGVALIGLDGRYQYINNKFIEMFGYSQKDILTGRDWFMKAFPDEEYREKVISTWVSDLKESKTGVSRPRQFNVRCKDGSEKIIKFRPVTMENGEQFVIYEDITESKRAEESLWESEQRYRTMLDFVPYPIVVFSLDGKVTYLNPAFTETFGWSFMELEGEKIPYVPSNFQQETSEKITKLFEDKIIPRHETKRLTKDGRLLDVVVRGALYSKRDGKPSEEFVIIRDITQEKRSARNNEAMLRISMALPGYPDLADLLDYISSEVKKLLGTEGALVTLLDEEKEELFFIGASYDDITTQIRVKEIRFPIDQIASGKVIRTGEPLIVSDASKDPYLYPERDKKLGYHTKNYILVPLRSGDRIIGALAAINKKEGTFERKDVELLSMIAGTAALSIENARSSEEVKRAYREVTSLNRAKDKIIHHLSHELKTPVSVVYGSIVTLEKRLKDLPKETWKPTIDRTKRNLDRLFQIQYVVEDIIQEKQYKSSLLMSQIIDQCVDELEAILAEEIGERPTINHIRKRIEEIFGPRNKLILEKIVLDEYIKERLECLKPFCSHRRVELVTHLERHSLLYIPRDVIQKIFEGLIKNAIENTPDEGKIEVIIRKKGEGTELLVRDYGVGITEENQRRIFEGFFTTRYTDDYSTKRPFDFNAGGKGTDLLRIKIFSERYHFKIDMETSRCRFIPNESDTCPGGISQCPFCNKKEDCYHSGGTTFTVYFPPMSKQREKSQLLF
ncbi:MAG: PAS domain S-box protein [Pseudomonadota bacterium]